jgi:hypothetical protein
MRAVADSRGHRLSGSSRVLPQLPRSRRLLRVILITQFANALTQLPNFFELHIVGFRIPRVDRVDFGFQLRKFRDEAR